MVGTGWRWDKPLLLMVALMPLGILIWSLFAGQLGANPLETLTHETGEWALRLLLATLAVTPLARLFLWTGLYRYRRMLGLLAFSYGVLHLLCYLWFDQGWLLVEIGRDLLKRPFILLGMSAFVLLLPLAATSTDRIRRWLGARRWRRLHRLIYPAALLAAVHFLLLVKADRFEPLIYLGILLLLLAARGLPTGCLSRRSSPRTS
ncbi:MAG: sulfoxide reductase heme-binding subunit YedZ [Gammaproteobacteria bacterium]|nr:sulfoxide reductase heme-binding subunit YedZ [Gammaproteobacteria bacterium]